MYVDTNLLQTGKVQKAAILGLKGGVWATSAGYTVRTCPCSHISASPIDASLQLSPEEQKAVVSAFVNPSATQANGVRLAGQKFITLQCNPEHIYGKKAASTTEVDTATASLIVS